MRASGATATCVAVQVETAADQLNHTPESHADSWETAAFILAAGPESKQDRRVLRSGPGVPLALETDLIEHDHAAIIVLRLIAKTDEQSPLVGEVLLTPGVGGAHFQALQLLTMQPRLIWFFGDKAFNVISSQSMPFGQAHHDHFESLLGDATTHDAMVRVTSRYDARAAIGDTVAHYEMRSATDRTEYQATRTLSPEEQPS